MIKSKSKSALKFEWSGIVDQEVTCDIDDYTLQVWQDWRDDGDFWCWYIWKHNHRGVIKEGRATGCRNLHKAKRLCEEAFVRLERKQHEN